MEPEFYLLLGAAGLRPEMTVFLPFGRIAIARAAAIMVGPGNVDVCQCQESEKPEFHKAGFRILEGDFAAIDPRDLRFERPMEMQTNQIVPGEERWLPIVGYEEFYEISTHGRIRRLKSRKGNLSGTLMNPTRRKDGYMSVGLCVRGNVKNFLVHSLVMRTFVGPCLEGMEVNHKHPDGDRSRNWLSNLEYVTSPRNNRDQRLFRPASYSRGRANPKSKINESLATEAKRRLANGERPSKIAKDFGVVCGTITAIRDGKTWHDPGCYDRVLFVLEENMEITLIRRAYDFVSPGGRLVAIMSAGPFFRNDSKATEFRDWLDVQESSVEDLPAGTFNGKDSFRQTGVASKLVVIDKAPVAEGDRDADDELSAAGMEV